MSDRIITLLAVLFGAALIVSRSSAAETLQPTHSVEGVSEYRLDNGLKVLLIPDLSVATLTTNVIVRAGSRHEAYGETGAAHLLEHLQFKGTAKYPSVAATMQHNGWAGYATAWYDHTNFITTMEGTKENLEAILQFEADRLTGSLLLPIHLEQEMPIVRNELENSESTPWGHLPPRLRAVSLEWHNYGKATIGNLADLEQMPIERVRDFYERYYQPDNVTLILAGRFDTQHALSSLSRYWGAIPRPIRTLAEDYTVEPAQGGERHVVVRRAGGVPMAGVQYHVPPASHPDFAAMHVVASWILGIPPGQLWKMRQATSRGPLHRSLVAAGHAASVHGSISHLRQRGFLEFYAPCGTNRDPQVALEQLIYGLESASKNDLTEDKVKIAKQRLLREVHSTILELPQLAVELTYWETNGDWRLFFLHRDRLENVQLNDVRRVAAKYLTASNRTAGLYYPERVRSRVEIPPPPDVAQLLEGYESRRPILSGEHIDPTPKEIESRLVRRKATSGTTIILLPKRTRGDRILMRFTLPFGNAETLSGRRAAASAFASVITSADAKEKARAGLRGSLAGFSISASGRPDSISFSIKVEPEYLDRGWPMFTKLIREPHFSENDFEMLKQSQIASLRNTLDSPFGIADRTVQRAGQPYDTRDPRHVPSIETQIEQLQALKIDDVRAAWQQLVGTGHGVFTAIGSFDPEEMVERVETLTSKWQSPTPYHPLSHVRPTTNPSAPIAKFVPDKTAAAYAADLFFDVGDNHDDYAALLVAQDILRLTRLVPRIRDDDGLCYYPRIDFEALPNSSVSRLKMRLQCNAGNLYALEVAVGEAFNSIRVSPFTAAELERAKTHLGNVTRTRLWSESQLLHTIDALAQQGRTLDYYVDLAARIDSISLAEVQRVAEKYLDPARMIVATVGSDATPGPITLE